MPQSIKIAFVHDFLLRRGGAERVLEALTKLYPDAPIYTLLYDEKTMGDVFPKEKIRCSYLQKLPSFFKRHYRMLFPLMPGAIERFDLDSYDVVLSSSSAYAHGVITSPKTKHINYCHSPMRYAWDWWHQYKREHNFGVFYRIGVNYFMKHIREWDRLASERPDIVIANSLNVQKRIKKYYRRDSIVIYPPACINRFRTASGNEDYFLIVSTLTPYKRIDLAIQLFNKLNRKLIIVGDGLDRKRLESIAQANIDFVGFRPDKVVAEYYKNCRALIFPGEEDFGIAPIEAMACGKPVLAYGRGGLLESIIPGVTGEFFYESTVESMEDGLGRLLAHEKAYNPKAIRKNVERFSEKIFLAKMKEIIEK